MEPVELEQIVTPAVDYRRHLERARYLAENDRPEEALTEFARSLELKPDYWETHFTLADLMLRQGDPLQALPLYRRTLELNPRFFPAYKNLGVTLRRLGRYDEALGSARVRAHDQPTQRSGPQQPGQDLRQDR